MTTRHHRPQPIRDASKHTIGTSSEPRGTVPSWSPRLKNAGRSGTLSRLKGMPTQPQCETRHWQGLAVDLGKRLCLPSLERTPCTYKVSREDGECIGYTDDSMYGIAWVFVWNSRNGLKAIMENAE